MQHISRLLFAFSSIVLLGCSAEDSLVPLLSSSAWYARLELNHHAILLSTVSPYDTVRLDTRPRTPTGELWIPSGYTAVEFDSVLLSNRASYISLDSSKVKVSSNGLVSAIAQTAANGTVGIVATWQFANVTRSDTAFVRVVNPPSQKPVHSYSCRPDSMKIGNNSSIPLRQAAKDQDGSDILNVLSYVTTSDVTVIRVNGKQASVGNLNLSSRKNTGAAHIRSEAYIYGITVIDTFTVNAGYPITGTFGIPYLLDSMNVLSIKFLNGYKTVNIGPGGTVSWNPTGDSLLIASNPITIIFDDPSTALPALAASQNSGGGNIAAINMSTQRYRRFLHPGVYPFRVEPFGLVGTVVVKDQ